MTNNKRGINPCTVEGCERLIFAKDWCKKHYDRHHKHGDPETLNKRGPKSWPTPEEYFWKRVVIKGEEDCWDWAGHAYQRPGRSGPGYGRFATGGKSYLAHRFSYALVHTVESYAPIHHTCGNTLCVNPKHLQATTSHENTAEMLERKWYKARIAELEGRLEKCTCGC